MVKIILLILMVAFFAMNMGASGVAPSFAAVYGARIIKKRKAAFLFGIFVVLGAVLLGRNVSLTLGRDLLPEGLLSFDTALVIVSSASLSLFLANILKIPQSTSQLAVGAIIGVGLYFRQIYFKTLFFRIIPLWIILPFLAYAATFLLYRTIYPPKNANLYIYEKLFAHEKKLKVTAVLVSCYVAFAVGTNNVGNAVGPLFGAGITGIMPGLLLVAPVFGIGAWLMGGRNLDVLGKKIVPLGIFSSSVVSFVTGTILILASLLGVPQSLVQLNTCSIFAVSALKNGHRSTLGMRITRRVFIVWAITPVFSMAVSYLLLFMINRF